MRRDHSRHQPSLSSVQRERIRRSREALVSGGLLTRPPGCSPVPPEIENSWRRCVSERVPVVPESLDYREPDDVLPVLRRAAVPVLDRLKDSFADVPVAMVLSDATGRIVVRHVDVRRQRNDMDRAGAAEGFDFSEHSIGTNGLGTVLVERRPVLVRGPEHYSALLENLTCAGTPIIEPATGRIVGSFSLACSLRDVHPLMTAMAADIGRQIESRLLEEAGDRHRRLVAAYLSVDRAGTGALVVDADTVLANRRGLAHTGPELHPLLWRFLCEHGPTAPTRMEVPLSDGMHDAVVEPVDGGDAAYSVRLLPHRHDRRPTAGAGAASVVRRDRLHVQDDADRRLEIAVRHHETIAVVGASGTGKLRTALRVLDRRGERDPFVVEPALDPGWFAAAVTAASGGRGLVLRRLHASPSPSVAQLQALVESGAPVVVTADLGAADDVVLGMVRRFATTVHLPGLEELRPHIPALVRHLLADLPDPESATRFSTAAWDLLMSWHWPDNLAELDATVARLARRARGGIVEADDLPEELHHPRRSRNLMESAEREAVTEALRAADGNRTRAAGALGIGRTTLYRKMREFGLG